MLKNIPHTFREMMRGFAHQDKEFLRSRDMTHYAGFWDMGTGKSKTMIDTFQYLYAKQEIDGVIIISDKGAYRNWTREEIPKQLPQEVPVRVGEWNSHMRKDERWRCDRMLTAKDDCLDIVVINVEAFSSQTALIYAIRFAQAHHCMIIVDEATSIKNIRAKRTQNIHTLGRMCDYRRVLTGTPMAESPLDVYSLFEFLKPGCLGFTSFVAFRSRYAVMEKQYLGPNRPTFDAIIGYQNMEELYEKMAPISSRYMKEDCLDLPEKLYEKHFVTMTPEQSAAYEDVKRKAVLMLDQGLLTVTNALAAMTKLRQITCGHVKLDDGTIADIKSNRVTELIELLEKLPGKALIWCAHQRDVQLVSEGINKHFQKNAQGGVTYYGLDRDEQRQCALTAFKNDPDTRWFIGTESTGGKGLNLTEAQYVIYYSNGTSGEDRQQSEDRAYRPGQTKNVTIIDMIVPDTADERCYNLRKEKKHLSDEVLSRFRELV